jgi:predicted dehydrogenase
MQRRGVDVVGLCGGRNGGKTQPIARQNGTPVVDCSLWELQAKYGANLLFVASSHHRHAALVQEVLDLGNFDIVCEKSLAPDLPTMDRFIEYFQTSFRLALINHTLGFYEPFCPLKAVVGFRIHHGFQPI